MKGARNLVIVRKYRREQINDHTRAYHRRFELNEMGDEDRCPECGNFELLEEDCIWCPSCGWTQLTHETYMNKDLNY